MKSFSSFDKTKIAYDIKQFRSKYTLIFLHGAGGNRFAWDEERKFFHKKKISTCAYDLRGHGQSQRPDLEKQYHLDCFAKDLETLIRVEKISHPVIIGHCFGGMITIKFAKLYPEIAKGYILIDTTYKAPNALNKLFHNHPILKLILNFRLEKVDIDPTFKAFTDYKKYLGTGDLNAKRIAEDIQHTTLKSWLFIYENIAEFDGRSSLACMKGPVLVVEGQKDRIFATDVAKTIHKIAKKSEYVEISGANHVLVINNPNELDKVIYDFLLDKQFIKE